MKKKDIETYQKELMSKFLSEKDLHFPCLLAKSIKNRIIEIIRSELTSNDRIILENFYDVETNIDLYKVVKVTKTSIYVPITTFLKNEGKTNLRYETHSNLLALILDFEPRPFSKYLKNEIIQTEEVNLNKDSINKNENTDRKPLEVIIKNPFKLNNMLLYSVVVITLFFGILVLNDLFLKDKLKLEQQPTTVIYNSYNGNLNYYYSTNKDGEILLYNNSQPNKKTNLKPVTQEVMLTYFKQQHVEVTNEDQKRWFKVNLEETNNANEVKKAETLVKKNEENSITKLKTVTKVIIKNNSTLDTQISNYFEKFYTKTKNKYLASGTVTYKYTESSFSKEMVVCELVLTYKVKLFNSISIFETGSITTTATGLSKTDAKNRAIKKIQFN